MKRYVICVVLCIGMCMCSVGCNEGTEEKPIFIPEQITEVQEVSITPIPTLEPIPTMTEQEFEEVEKKQREQEILALMATPTPGPEPYSVYGVEIEIQKGDVVILGEFVHGMGKEAVEDPALKWIVLDVEQNRALLLSLYNVYAMVYITVSGEAADNYWEHGVGYTWECSRIREWLHTSFYERAFDYRDRECILETIVHTSDNAMYGTDGGEDTNDKLFLLSVEEVQKYFVTDNSRMTQIVPDWKAAEMVYRGEQPHTTDYYDWWLRSPGKNTEHVACVGRFGELILDGVLAYDEQVSVRPAMWIDLEKVKEIGLELEAE